MIERAIGDAKVTAIGAGDVRFALAAARGIDRREVERALHHALELGITFVDASEEPDAERACGEAVRALRLRDRAIIATRVIAIEKVVRDTLPERLPPAYVQERIEASLRTTKLDVLPLAQIPMRVGWLESRAWPELVGMLAKLVQEGKVLRWGAILDDADGHAAFAEPFVSLQMRFNACQAPTLATKLTVLAREPLAGAALAGTLGPGVRLAPRDDRHLLDDAELERIAVTIAMLAPSVRHEPPAAQSCKPARAARERTPRPPAVDVGTVAELALRYVIDRNTIALPRLHRYQHVLEAIVAVTSPRLPDALHARLDELFA
ncbi:MAG: aldo/keto reductase [Kofleriaceae bacterium]